MSHCKKNKSHYKFIADTASQIERITLWGEGGLKGSLLSANLQTLAKTTTLPMIGYISTILIQKANTNVGIKIKGSCSIRRIVFGSWNTAKTGGSLVVPQHFKKDHQIFPTEGLTG